MALLEKKVKPDRQRKDARGKYVQRSPLPEKWWIHAEKRPAMYESIASCQVVGFHAYVSKYMLFASLPKGYIYAGPHYVFPLPRLEWLGVLQSRVHEIWAIFFSASFGDGLRYTPSDCFDTFAFPGDDSTAAEGSCGEGLRNACSEYFKGRSEFMIDHSIGLTGAYNLFHDPECADRSVKSLRCTHNDMDQAVLAAYGWSDVPTACGFGLDYIDLEEDAQVPEELQERIDSGELFFWDANDALDFQGQLQAYGAITGRRKLPWRYRWPDAVRDDVLARLLALNAERYKEEVAQGLHGGGRGRGGRGNSGGSGTGRRRGRPPKNPSPDSGQTAQMGLAL